MAGWTCSSSRSRASSTLTIRGTLNGCGNGIDVQGNTGISTSVRLMAPSAVQAGFTKTTRTSPPSSARSNCYSGQTTIIAGTVRVNSGADLGSGDFRLASEGNLELNDSSTIASDDESDQPVRASPCGSHRIRRLDDHLPHDLSGFLGGLLGYLTRNVIFGAPSVIPESNHFPPD